MRKAGYTCQVVEKWNPFVKIRQDLFGFIDILCIKEGETVGVQSTTKDNALARVKKIELNETYPIVKKAGWRVLVHGWFKEKNRWQVKETEL